jgi:Glycosyltransferase family 17
MKIFDCFTFYNEFDLLELRLKEHWDHVDYFVISEANRTHQNKPKPFLLKQNWNKFKDFHEKIIHIMVDDMPTDNPDPWTRETFQRNTLARGLSLAKPDDIIAVSDVDELVRKSTWDTIRNDTVNDHWGGYIPFFQFKLNFLLVTKPMAHFYTPGVMATRKKLNITPQNIRESREYLIRNIPYMRQHRIVPIHHAGWHFSFIGDDNFVKQKYLSYAHWENAYLSQIVDVQKSIKNKSGTAELRGEKFEIVEINDYFPEALQSNLLRWKDFILENPVAKLDKTKGMLDQQITMYNQNDIDIIQREMIIKYHRLID